MGLFDSLFGGGNKKQQADERLLLDEVEVAPGIVLPRAFAEYSLDIQKAAITFAKIKATPGNSIPLQASKFGHYPCIPLDFEYPKDSSGQYMYPVAQINCRDIVFLEGFPHSGYLQFYIAAFDDVYGLDFDDMQSQKDFRVLYFEEDEVEQHKTDFSFLYEVMQSDMLPVYKPHSLQITEAMEYLGLDDVRNNRLRLDLLKITEKYPSIETELFEALYATFRSNGHKMGGYAYFTQEDPRMNNAAFKDYILLFQLDSDDEIMWGDVGVANFFIHPEDLAKKDFSKVMYSWDCS